MWDQMRKPIRRVAIRGVIALIAASLFVATASQHVLPLTKQRAYNVMQVAQIDESPSTIGVSDSDLYFAQSVEEINARLDLMQSLGVTNVRILVPWANVQPLHPDTPFGLGAPNWGQLDKVVNAAAARGMGILGVLNSTPIWATSSLPLNGQPTDFNQFAAFAKSVALRYGAKISAYEVWNEPNSIQFWNSVNPVSYTDMLKVTYTALKQAAAQLGTDITVIGGVVGAGMTISGLTMNPVDFVRKMYEAGAHGFFDALSFHSYNMTWKFSSGQGSPWHESPLLQLNKIRALMDSFLEDGQEQLKIWMTEYGLPTNVVSETTQAAFVEDMVRFWQTVSGAGPVFLYTIKDWLDGAANNNEAHFGIFRPDGTMKPVGQIIKDLIAFLVDPDSNPGAGPGQTPELPVSNPFDAFIQVVQQALATVMSLLPNLITAVSAIVTNFINGIFGAPTPAPAPNAALRTALVNVDEDAELVGTTENTDAGTDVDANAATADLGEETVVTEHIAEEKLVTAQDPPNDAPAAEVVGEESPVVVVPADEELIEEEVKEETPLEEVPADEEVAGEAPSEGVTESEAEGLPETADNEVDSMNDKVNDESQKAGDTTFAEKNDTTLRTGKRDAVATDSTDTVGPDVRESAVPSLKARHEQGSRTSKGPQSAEQSSSDSGQGSPARQNAEASSASGGDD